MSAHTPGPWTENGDDGVIHGADGIPVCEVTAPGPTKADLRTALANARLIAAAPELLAELKGALREHEDDHCDGCDAGCPLGEGWRQLIAKAEGKS